MNHKICAALLVAAACDHGGAPVTAAPALETQSTEQPRAAFIAAKGVGPSEDAAYAEATRALAKKLLGDEAWLGVVPIEVHARSPNLDRRALPGGDVEIRLSLTQSEAAAVISAFEGSRPNVAAPAQWRDTVFDYLLAHIGEHACLRRRELFGVTCETETTTDADAALAELVRAVTLSPGTLGGVPLDAEGRPLRQPGVIAFWHAAPVRDVPLRAEIGGEVVRLQTNADGRAELPLPSPQQWPGPMSISVDAQALLGPKHSAWAVAPLVVRSREIDPKRWTAVLADGSGSVLDAAARDSFVSQMRAAGFGDPKRIEGLGPKVSQDALSRFADRAAGEVDMVVLLNVTSAFASRAGGGRVWYEATGQITALNLWNPDDSAFPSFDLTVTASGVGDQRAGQAARRKFCSEAAAKLVGLLGDQR